MVALRSAQGDVDRAAELLLLSSAAPEMTLEAPKVFWVRFGMDFWWKLWFVLGLFVMFDGFLVKTLDFSLDFWVDVDSLVILLKNLVELVWFI